jgi:hypothetical protein
MKLKIGNNFTKLIAVLILGFKLTGLQAQEAVLSSGGVAMGSGGSVTYSVGQVVYTYNTDKSGTVAQGVQQPYEISIIPEFDESQGISLQCSVYPNPVIYNLTLHFENQVIEDMSFFIYDAKGKRLMTQKIESRETIIFMGNFTPSTYFLKVMKTRPKSTIQDVRTFKIIKNN